MNYTNTIIFYFDILGFKNLVDTSIDQNGCEVVGQTDKLLFALKQIEGLYNMDSTTYRQFLAFSDTVVVTMEGADNFELELMILRTSSMQRILLENSILLRGAVVSGLLYNDGKRIFGPAIIEAYLLEKDKAKYPRIIVDEKLVQFLKLQPKATLFVRSEDRYLRIDDDGVYYINYFIHGHISKKAIDTFPFDLTTPGIAEKHRWLLNKLNAVRLAK